MKLDPVFTVKENKLYKIEDNSLVDVSTLKQVQIPWSTIEMEDEVYNEEYLANLREELKHMEVTKTYVILIPVVDKPLSNAEQFELFTNAYNHCARRVKDAESVAGYKLPKEMIIAGFGEGTPSADFIETIAKKHAQYVTFADKIEGIDYKNTESNIVIL